MSLANENIIGKNIRQLRLEQNLSQDQLAEKVMATKSTISKWESGAQIPSVDSLRWLSSTFNKPIFVILGEKPNSLRDKMWSRFGRSMFYILFWWAVDAFVGLQALLGAAACVILAITFPLIKPVTILAIDGTRGSIDYIEIIKAIGFFLATPLFSIICFGLGITLMKIFQTYIKFSNKIFWNIKLKTMDFKFKMPKVPKSVFYLAIAGIIIGLILIIICIALVAKDNSWSNRMW